MVKLGPRVWRKDEEQYNTLVSLFAELPFEWLKKIIESQSFEVPSDMERWMNDLSSRFALAKQIIALRTEKKNLEKSRDKSEENVLLAFGSGSSGK